MQPYDQSPASQITKPVIQGPFVLLFLGMLLSFASQPEKLYGQLAAARISLLDGTEIQGRIRSIDEAGNVVGDRLPAGLQLSEISSIVMIEKPQTSSKAGRVAIGLVNGSQLLSNGVELEGEVLRFESAMGVDSVPLQVVSSIVWRDSELLKQQVDQSLTAEDRVIVQSSEGERMVQGLVEGLNAQQLSIQYQNQSRKIGVERINAVLMADIGVKPQQGSIASLVLNDASEVKGLIQELKNEQITIRLTESVSINIPAGQVGSISILSDRQRFLSDLEPIDVQQKTEFTIQRKWQRNLNVQGGRLVLTIGNANQVQEFAKGLGTQAFTQLDYVNENAFSRFKATVGIDTDTNGKGDCRMVVRGDGIELWSARVKGNDVARQIDVDITGIKIVSLVVEPGEAFDLADHANWCDARFIK